MKAAPPFTRKSLRIACAALAAAGLVTVAPLPTTASTANATPALPVLHLGYEDGTKTSGTDVGLNECCAHSIDVVDLARTGRYAMRSHLKYGDPMVEGGTRAESHTLKMENTHFAAGYIAFYGFSIYIPSTWKNDSREDIVFQWKAWPDACEANKFPSAFLSVQPSGTWRLRVNSDSNRCSTPESVQKTSYDLGEVKPGEWHDFVFNFKWSHGSDGLIVGWYQTHKNPGWVKVVSAPGPNTFNDDPTTKGYLKWGIYKPAWNDGPTDVDSRALVHDNITVGTPFLEVDPAVR